MSVAPSVTTDSTDSTDHAIADRDRRALLEALSTERIAPGMYRVYSERGTEYVVDIDGGACTCPDFRYREVECKHLRRARLEAGDRDTTALAELIDAAIDAVDERIAELASRQATLVRLRAALEQFE